MNKKVRLIKELKKLQEAFANITTQWYVDTELCDDVLEPDFPFDRSFDEVSRDVFSWVESAVEELEYTFKKYEKVHYTKQPMQYTDGVPNEYYFQEREGNKILISTEILVEDDGYNDAWVDYECVVPVTGWPNDNKTEKGIM